MANGLRNMVACVGGLIILCCVSAPCFGESDPDCSACECPSSECPSCCNEEGCPHGCCEKTACCDKSAATQPSTSVVIADVELLFPAVPMTMKSLLGGTLPSDAIAELATTPTGLASCGGNAGPCSECGKECAAQPEPGSFFFRVLAVRNVLQDTPSCSLELDPKTFTLFSGEGPGGMTCETSVILAKFNELQQDAVTCCVTCQTRPHAVSPEQATALREAAEQLAKVAVSLEEADLTDQAARARSLAQSVVAGLTESVPPSNDDAVAQPAQDEILR